MKGYYRLMLGQKSVYAQDCLAGGFVGVDFIPHEDLSRRLPEDLRAFNKQFIPIYLAVHPDKTKIGAGLACGALWTVSKGFRKGDLVLCPDGAGAYRVGEVQGDYYYVEGQVLPHRRRVTWLDTVISRSSMSEALRNSSGSIGTVSDITVYHAEIEALLGSAPRPTETIMSANPEVEDPLASAMETHLESFLVANWS